MEGIQEKENFESISQELFDEILGEVYDLGVMEEYEFDEWLEGDLIEAFKEQLGKEKTDKLLTVEDKKAIFERLKEKHPSLFNNQMILYFKLMNFYQKMVKKKW